MQEKTDVWTQRPLNKLSKCFGIHISSQIQWVSILYFSLFLSGEFPCFSLLDLVGVLFAPIDVAHCCLFGWFHSFWNYVSFWEPKLNLREVRLWINSANSSSTKTTMISPTWLVPSLRCLLWSYSFGVLSSDRIRLCCTLCSCEFT